MSVLADKRRQASLFAVAKAVFWSFLGIRRKSALESDVVNLKPVQVIVAGIIGAALFVTTILLVVRYVIKHAAG